MPPNVRRAREEHFAPRVVANNHAILVLVRGAVPVRPENAGAVRPDRAAYWKQPSRRLRESQNTLPPAVGHTHSKPGCVRPPILKPAFELRGLVPSGAKRGPQLRCGRRYRSVDATVPVLGGRLG